MCQAAAASRPKTRSIAEEEHQAVHVTGQQFNCLMAKLPHGRNCSDPPEELVDRFYSGA